MRITEYGRQRIYPLEFWIAVVGVILFLGVMGAVYMNTGRMPSAPRWVFGITLVFVWAGFLFRVRHYGHEALAPLRLLFPIGFTLMASCHAAPGIQKSISWLEGVGDVLVMTAILSQYIGFGKPAASENGSEEEGGLQSVVELR